MVAYAIRFKVPLIPPSVNSLYNVFRMGPRLEVKLKPEVLLFKTKVKQYVPGWAYKHAGERLFFTYTYMDMGYFFKNGKVRRVDLANTEKALLDAICEKIGVDDSYVKERKSSHWHNAKETYLQCEIGVIAGCAHCAEGCGCERNLQVG